MWRNLVLAVLLAGCAQLPPTPQDIQAKKFEPVPDKAVIYLVRDYPDFSDAAGTLWLGDAATITTYPGTYFRWEVKPGEHRIAGFGADAGAVTVRTEAGRIYYVLQRLSPFMRFPQSQFWLIDESHGRAAVQRAVLLGGS